MYDGYLHTVPYMTYNYLYIILASCTVRKVWTVFADTTATFILPISVTVGGTIGQYLIVWTDIAIAS